MSDTSSLGNQAVFSDEDVRNVNAMGTRLRALLSASANPQADAKLLKGTDWYQALLAGRSSTDRGVRIGEAPHQLVPSPMEVVRGIVAPGKQKQVRDYRQATQGLIDLIESHATGSAIPAP